MPDKAIKIDRLLNNEFVTKEDIVKQFPLLKFPGKEIEYKTEITPGSIVISTLSKTDKGHAWVEFSRVKK